MNINRFKPLMAVLLACYIDLAICGFQSPGQASDTVNQMSNWTILRPHSIGLAADGTYFMEVVLLGNAHGVMCWAQWQSPIGTYACPDSTATISGDVIERRLSNSAIAEPN
jgi:hypothetical protein